MNDSAALTSATTRELVAAAQSGTDAARPALDQLLTVNEGLCRKVVANVRQGETPTDEDLLQTARLAFVRAVQAYRPAGGASLSTFAWAVMHKAVIKEAHRRRVRALRLPVATVEAKPDCELSRSLDRLVLRAALGALPAADRDLLARIYDQDRSQTAVAADLGVSHTAVHKRHRRIITDLRLAVSA